MVARSVLQADLRHGRLEKTYLAWASGAPSWTARTLDAPIGPVPHGRLGTVHAVSDAGRASRSVARVVGRRGDSALLEVTIPTGRPHQIRAHLAWAGHPLVGDPLYEAGGRPRSDALPGDEGYWLHAWRLTLVHPVRGVELELVAPPPAELVWP
jgi:23S rRNA pseudouridine1911/1915/1917 synthase